MRILRAEGESESSSRRSISCSLMTLAGDICPSVRLEGLSKKSRVAGSGNAALCRLGAQLGLFLACILVVVFVRQQSHGLPFKEPLIDASGSPDQLVMTALFEDCALFEDKDAVEHPN